MNFRPLPTVPEVGARLNTIFPPEFPDRTILVGLMSARTVFVCLYGNFVEGSGNYFRPANITGFTDEQAAMVTQAERAHWVAYCCKHKFASPGRVWYEKGSREPIRDDLIRNRLIPLGIIKKLEGYPTTHPAPIHCLDASFADLFDPELTGAELDEAIDAWRQSRLDSMTLRRMKLAASGVKAREGQVPVTLPTTGKTLRLVAGHASVITKDVCEIFAPAVCREPVVVHVSASDQKTFPELTMEARAVGLSFDPSAELPDVVIAEIGKQQLEVYFVEVVHSDGPMTEVRKRALLRIAREAGISKEHVRLVTAFESRGSAAFKKRVSELATDSMVWFRTEPDLVMRWEPLGPV